MAVDRVVACDTNHCVCFTSSCLPIRKDSAIIALQQKLNHIFSSCFVDVLLC